MARGPKRQAKPQISQTIMEINDQLFKASTVVPTPDNAESSSKEIGELVSKIQTLQRRQEGDLHEPYDDDKKLQLIKTFMEWCTKNGVKTDQAEVAEFTGYGLGLQAKVQIQHLEQFLSIPASLILSIAHPHHVIAPLLGEDPIALGMPNVALALNLIAERGDPQSKWKPYIDVLPRKYDTTLYFTREEMFNLAGSVALDQSINLQRNIARQYSYFFKIMQARDQYKPLRHSFTYNMYRWAVSTVMTRQNRIPNLGMSLIPFWDMCNHKSGEVLTDYNSDAAKLTSYAMDKFSAGEQIFMCYNKGSNCDFVCHNGFLSTDNPHNKISLKLRLLKKDPLRQVKAEMISKWVPEPASCSDDPLSISYVVEVPSLTSWLVSGMSSSDENGSQDTPTNRLKAGVEAQVLTFLRISCSSKEQLDCLSKRATESDDFNPVKQPFDTENEKKCWKMLDLNCTVLLKGYKQDFTAKEGLKHHEEMARQLIKEEKAMINDIKQLCAEKLIS